MPEVAKVRSYAGGLGFINALYPEARPGILYGLTRSLIGGVAKTIAQRPNGAAISMAAYKGRLAGFKLARKELL